jgi:hypothetical protein
MPTELPRLLKTSVNIGTVIREYEVANVAVKQEETCKILGSQGGYPEHYCLLEYDIIQSERQQYFGWKYRYHVQDIK